VTSRVQENTPLAPLTTLGVGGPARYLLEASTEAGVAEGVAFARSRGLPLLVLGGGSNLLVSDRGFPGLVLRARLEEVRVEHAKLVAGAGVSWDALVEVSVGRGLAGIECLSGIPGLVGGTPIQNVGAYGQEVSDVVRRVRVYDREDDTFRDLTPAECGFAYRSSIFNTAGRGRYVVLEVEYLLEDGAPPSLRYPDLIERFPASGVPPGLDAVRRAVLEIRRSKAMLAGTGDSDSRSAGSFFRNPILGPDAFQSLAARHPGVPSYAVEDGVKVPAAWLIETAGFNRGTTDGPVGLSSRHALALVNRGGARAADVLRFARSIGTAVEDRFGIRLRTEPAFAGFDDGVLAEFGAVPA
jgi:UDP-N-acetylmuramate dehydrogenase